MGIFLNSLDGECFLLILRAYKCIIIALFRSGLPAKPGKMERNANFLIGN